MLLSGGFECICQKAISCIWKTQINRNAAKARAISTYPRVFCTVRGLEKTLVVRFLGYNQHGLGCTYVCDCSYFVSNYMFESVHCFCFQLCNNIIYSINHSSFFHAIDCFHFFKNLGHRCRFGVYENEGCWQKNPRNYNYVGSGIFQCRLLGSLVISFRFAWYNDFVKFEKEN